MDSRRCKSAAELYRQHGGLVRWAVEKELERLRALRGFPAHWEAAFDVQDVMQTVWVDVCRYAPRYVAALRQDYYLSHAARRATTQYVNDWYGFKRSGRPGRNEVWNVVGKFYKCGVAFGQAPDGLSGRELAEWLDRESFDEHLRTARQWAVSA